MKVRNKGRGVRVRWIVFAAIAACSVAASTAQSAGAPVYPVETYAKLPSVMSPKLSPDGKSIAYLTAVTSGRKTLVAHPIRGEKKGRSFALPHLEGADIAGFRWANDAHVLVIYSFFKENIFYKSYVSGNESYAVMEQTRLFSASLSGDVFNAVKPSRAQHNRLVDDTNPLATRSRVSVAQIQHRIIDMLPDDPKHILLSLDEDIDGDPGVRRIDITTGKFDLVVNDKDDIWHWVPNANGEPTLGWGYEKNMALGKYTLKPKVYIAPSDRGTWSQDAILQLIDGGATPIKVMSDNLSAVFDAYNEKGRRSFGVFDLRDGTLIKWLFSHPRYDAQDYYTSGITGDIVGATYIDDQERQVFVSGKEKMILRLMDKLLTGAANRVINSDRAGNLFLIEMQKTQETPKYFIFDLEGRTLSLFSAPYKAIDDAHVAPVSRQVADMRDGLKIEVYVTSPIGSGDIALPTILLPHGGPSARDSADFDYLAQLFANRGYRVLQPNFRGSSGYGSGFKKMAKENWGRQMQDDLEDTMAWAIDNGLSHAAKTCIVGWSYGGYAALMGAVKTPDLFNCAVSINGVANLPQLWTDDGNFKGGVEWRKGFGATRSDTVDISPYHRADEIKVPIMLIAAKDDARVDYAQSKGMYKRLKKNKTPVEYVELKSGGHSIDVDAQRVKFMKEMVRFIGEHIDGKSASR